MESKHYVFMDYPFPSHSIGLQLKEERKELLDWLEEEWRNGLALVNIFVPQGIVRGDPTEEKVLFVKIYAPRR